MEKEQLFQLMNETDVSDENILSELKEIHTQYPYFQTADLIISKALYISKQHNSQRNIERTAVFCASRAKLFYYLHHEKYQQFLSLEDYDKTEDRTLSLLDSFLGTISNDGDKTDKDNLIAPTEDYLSYSGLSNEQSTKSDDSSDTSLKHQDIIDNFIQKAESDEIHPIKCSASGTHHTSDNEIGNENYLTETLAGIYIKQQKYEQALKIIKRLSLNFPQKSIYFADQIRFLEYLIVNEKNKKR